MWHYISDHPLVLPLIAAAAAGIIVVLHPRAASAWVAIVIAAAWLVVTAKRIR